MRKGKGVLRHFCGGAKLRAFHEDFGGILVLYLTLRYDHVYLDESWRLQDQLLGISRLECVNHQLYLIDNRTNLNN